MSLSPSLSRPSCSANPPCAILVMNILCEEEWCRKFLSKHLPLSYTHVLNKVQYKQEGHDSCDHVMLLVLCVYISTSSP